MAFRYFRHPYKFSTYTSEAQACDLCGQVRPGYKGPYYGRARVKFVCEKCLVAGRLAEVAAFTNEGGGEIREQLRTLHPELGEDQVLDLVRERVAELAYRTPHLVTWQDLSWPAHCGDYCCFVQEVGKPDLNALAPDGDGREFLSQHLRDSDRAFTDVQDVWESVRPDSPKDNSVAYAVGVYLFQCLHCQEVVIVWDCE